jgi:hypothetical protein
VFRSVDEARIAANIAKLPELLRKRRSVMTPSRVNATQRDNHQCGNDKWSNEGVHWYTQSQAMGYCPGNLCATCVGRSLWVILNDERPGRSALCFLTLSTSREV